MPLIPKGAKNVAVAKEFLKYLIQPKVLQEFVETGLGRYAAPDAGTRQDARSGRTRRTRI